MYTGLHMVSGLCSIDLLYFFTITILSWNYRFIINFKDAGLIPGSGRYPRIGKSNPLQYSCLENPIDREAWQATVLGAAKSQTHLSTEHSKMITVSCPYLLFFDTVGNSKSFSLLYKFWNQSVGVYKIFCWDFNWDCIELTDNLGKNSFLTIFSHSICKHGISPPKKYPSIYLVLLWFLSTEFCSILIQILLGLYLSISFFQGLM